MERVLDMAPPLPARISAESFLASVLPDFPGRSVTLASDIMSAAAEAPPLRPPAAVYESAPPAREAPEPAPWHRLTLDKGLELHYQPTGDPERDAVIQRIVADAMKRLNQSRAGKPAGKDRRGKGEWFHAKKQEGTEHEGKDV
jgi:hypothetical protein